MDILKGNFKVKKKPKLTKKEKKSNSFDEEFKKKAIENIGGSMVFVDRKTVVWDGD